MKIAEPKCPECDMKRSANPFALAFCVNCGHIVGFAGRGYS
ncbi:MAG: hypothetical protein ACTSSK_15765 [Candidatus Heimdallarchaeota archaeon]